MCVDQIEPLAQHPAQPKTVHDAEVPLYPPVHQDANGDTFLIEHTP
jgi:hypothetical protein